MNFTVSTLTLALVATVANAAESKTPAFHADVMRAKFAQRSLASKLRQAAPAQPDELCFTKAEFDQEQESATCKTSADAWIAYCDANEQADGTLPKECDDLWAKYIDAVEQAYPDFDWSDESSGEGESEDEAEALIMKKSNKFMKRALAKKTQAAPAQPDELCFTKAEFEQEQESATCLASTEAWIAYCDANEQADGSFPKECDDLLAKYTDALEKAYPGVDFDWEAEFGSSSEGESEDESEDEAKALIMKSRMMFAKSVVSKKRHAAPAKKALTKKVLTKKTQAAPAALPADQCFTEMLTGTGVQSPACEASMGAWTVYCRANQGSAGCVELQVKEAKIVADHFKNMSFTKKTQAAPAMPADQCFLEHFQAVQSPDCKASWDAWDVYCKADPANAGCAELQARYAKSVAEQAKNRAPAALPADQCFTEMLTGVQSPACKASMDAWTDYCRANQASAGCVELRAKEAKIVADHFANMSFAKKRQAAPAMPADQCFLEHFQAVQSPDCKASWDAWDVYCKADQAAAGCAELQARYAKSVAEQAKNRAPAMPTDQCFTDMFQLVQSPDCKASWDAWEVYCKDDRASVGCAEFDAKFVKSIEENFNNRALTKKTQAAPAALPADQCFTEMLTGVQSPACKTSMDAWTDYCRANPADAGCVELRAKEAKIVAEHFANMSFTKKTQDAPAFDVKCADSDHLTRTEECWDQIFAMDTYCWINAGANSLTDACTEYESAVFGVDGVMRKSFTALKAMKKQVSLMGEVETADSSSFAGVAVGAAVGTIIGAAGAIIAARSCTLKTDDTFQRI